MCRRGALSCRLLCGPTSTQRRQPFVLISPQHHESLSFLSRKLHSHLLLISWLVHGALGEAAASLAQVTQGLREAAGALAMPPALLPGRDVTLSGRDVTLAPHFGRHPSLALRSACQFCQHLFWARILSLWGLTAGGHPTLTSSLLCTKLYCILFDHYIIP